MARSVSIGRVGVLKKTSTRVQRHELEYKSTETRAGVCEYRDTSWSTRVQKHEYHGTSTSTRVGPRDYRDM